MSHYLLRVQQLSHPTGQLSKLVSVARIIPMDTRIPPDQMIVLVSRQMDAEIESAGYELEGNRLWEMEPWVWNASPDI